MLLERPTRPMKVLHILDELSHSGAEVLLQLAYKRFERNGIDSHILSTGNHVGAYAAFLAIPDTKFIMYLFGKASPSSETFVGC